MKRLKNSSNIWRRNTGASRFLLTTPVFGKTPVLAMMKEAEWHDVLDVNLSGIFYMCKFSVMSMMQKRYGRIINITSPSGKYGFEGQANYAAAKAGLVALTKSLSKEVARRGITVIVSRLDSSRQS